MMISPPKKALAGPIVVRYITCPIVEEITIVAAHAAIVSTANMYLMKFRFSKVISTQNNITPPHEWMGPYDSARETRKKSIDSLLR
jgi:hypothetical protein